MPDPGRRGLGGLRVALLGDAEASLVDATRDTFTSAGCEIVAVAQADAGPGVGPSDVAVVFARRASTTPLIELEDGPLAEAVERELLRPQRAALAAARSMAARSGGVVVVVGSVDAFHAYPGRSVAAVAMGGLLGLLRSMAVEMAGRGVRANLVVAGPLGGEDGGPPPDEARATVERTLMRSPSHRFARPSEIASAIRFVASPDAAFMTGQTLRVDGGWASLNQAPEGMRFP